MLTHRIYKNRRRVTLKPDNSLWEDKQKLVIANHIKIYNRHLKPFLFSVTVPSYHVTIIPTAKL